MSGGIGSPEPPPMGEASKRRAASARTPASAPTVPIRLMASARRVGVRSLSPGVASKPKRCWVGPMSAATASWSASSCAGQRDALGEDQRAADGGPGRRVGLETEPRGQHQELLERRVTGQGGGPGVGHQVGSLQGGELGEAFGQRRPVRRLVADPEHAPAAGVDHGEARVRPPERVRGRRRAPGGEPARRAPLRPAPRGRRGARATPSRWTTWRPGGPVRGRTAAG